MSDELRDKLRQAYDHGALRREHSELPAWKHEERSRFLLHLQARQQMKLLEVGAGTGRDGRFFADAGCDVTCIDLSAAMVALCRNKGLTASMMDVAHLTFADATFDAVYSFNSLLHLPKAELPHVLQEIRRVLKPGGLFYFGTYGGSDYEGVLKDDHHVPRRFFSFYEDAHLRRVTSAAFDEVAFESLEIPCPEGCLRFQSLLLQCPSLK